MNILCVAGRFDEMGGRPSGYMRRLIEACGAEVEAYNGGSLDAIPELLAKAHRYQAVWWWPDIDNSVPKFAGTLKDHCPQSVLVLSKNNRAAQYTVLDLVARMLKSRANLMLEIQGAQAPFSARVLDPLGNCFLNNNTSPEETARALLERTQQLMQFTRQSSRCVGPAKSAEPSPELDRFLEIAKGYAETFHSLVHAANPSRFLGNASFRCTKGGFPSYRQHDQVYISKRNLDKRQLATDGFVAIDMNEGPIHYYGEAKPSVDAPIQRALFQALPSLRYMLHAHVYILGAPFTQQIVPCGALEEVPEVLALTGPDITQTTAINLRGHGCLILAQTPDGLAHLPFIPRPHPEFAF